MEAVRPASRYSLMMMMMSLTCAEQWLMSRSCRGVDAVPVAGRLT